MSTWSALQAYRNSVPVPRHWSQKRKYLQGKRGIEKPAFRLPEFIEATGIGEMRQAYHEKVGSSRFEAMPSLEGCCLWLLTATLLHCQGAQDLKDLYIHL